MKTFFIIKTLEIFFKKGKEVWHWPKINPAPNLTLTISLVFAGLCQWLLSNRALFGCILLHFFQYAPRCTNLSFFKTEHFFLPKPLSCCSCCSSLFYSASFQIFSRRQSLGEYLEELPHVFGLPTCVAMKFPNTSTCTSAVAAADGSDGWATSTDGNVMMDPVDRWISRTFFPPFPTILPAAHCGMLMTVRRRTSPSAPANPSSFIFSKMK